MTITIDKAFSARRVKSLVAILVSFVGRTIHMALILIAAASLTIGWASHVISGMAKTSTLLAGGQPSVNGGSPQ
jgi:hypothetical protein